MKATAWQNALIGGVAIIPGAREGITLMDHPANYNHPSVFHVRDDGWMGSALTFGGDKVIMPNQPLVLRYGLYIHRGVPKAATIEMARIISGRVKRISTTRMTIRSVVLP